MNFDPIKITPEEVAMIRKLDEQRASNAAFAEQVRQAGERRNMELVGQGRELWTMLAKKYSLDNEHCQYSLNKEGDALIVLAAQFSQ